MVPVTIVNVLLFRILISLLDKPEIGPVVIESVLLSVFRRLKMEAEIFASSPDRNSQSENSKIPVETLKTANLLFGSFEPYFIWDFLARMFRWGTWKETFKTWLLLYLYVLSCLIVMMKCLEFLQTKHFIRIKPLRDYLIYSCNYNVNLNILFFQLCLKSLFTNYFTVELVIDTFFKADKNRISYLYPFYTFLLLFSELSICPSL